jgi:tRNA uridine 5-carboxymethylaminomethyl modification enzyme
MDAAERIEAEIKYDGYIKRQYAQVEKMDRLESLNIPNNFDFSSQALNISNEGRQKLSEIRPQTIGQASRISGISPADVSTLMVVLHAHDPQEKSSTNPS